MPETKDIELRDWFAGQALAGILSKAHYPRQDAGEPFDLFAASVTNSAYRIAGAVIEERRRLTNVNNCRM